MPVNPFVRAKDFASWAIFPTVLLVAQSPIVDESTKKTSSADNATAYRCNFSSTNWYASAISPECCAILAEASSGVSTPSAISVANNSNSGSTVFALPLSKIGFIRSFKVLNSNFSNSGLVLFSSTPLHAKASILKSKGTFATNWVNSRFRITSFTESRSD